MNEPKISFKTKYYENQKIKFLWKRSKTLQKLYLNYITLTTQIPLGITIFIYISFTWSFSTTFQICNILKHNEMNQIFKIYKKKNSIKLFQPFWTFKFIWFTKLNPVLFFGHYWIVFNLEIRLKYKFSVWHVVLKSQNTKTQKISNKI